MKFQTASTLSFLAGLAALAKTSLAECPSGLPEGAKIADLGTILLNTDARQEDGRYQVEANTEGTAFDTELGLWNDIGNILAQNNNIRPPDNLNSKLIINLLPGTYVFGGSEFQTTFSSNFLIDIEDDSINGGDFQFELIAEGSADSPISASLSIESEGIERAAYFCFTLEEKGLNLRGSVSDVIDTAVRDLNCPNGIPDGFNTVFLGQISEGPVTVSINTLQSDFDTELALWDEDGNLIDQNDDSNNSFQSELQLTLEQGEYVAGGTRFNVEFGDNFFVSGGVRRGEVLDYVLTITDSDGNTLTESVTIEDQDIVVFGEERAGEVKAEAVLFCFSVGPNITPDEVVETLIDTTGDIAEDVFSNVQETANNLFDAVFGTRRCFFFC